MAATRPTKIVAEGVLVVTSSIEEIKVRGTQAQNLSDLICLLSLATPLMMHYLYNDVPELPWLTGLCNIYTSVDWRTPSDNYMRSTPRLP